MSALETVPGFKERRSLYGGNQWIYSFDHGWGASVVRHEFSYGNREGLYELAVFRDGKINYQHPVSRGDVRGGLTVDEAIVLLEEIAKSPEVAGG